VKLFSAFAAAELLERDRQTLTRALRSTPPDGQERGQPRWKMSTIVDALTRHTRANDGGSTGTSDPVLAKAHAKFDAKFDEMTAAPTLAKRRTLAKRLAPQIADMDRECRAHGRAIGEDAELTALRADRLFQLTLIGFQGPCEWSSEQCFENLDVTADAA
jgi:hypothetical protein